jgi:hypothetical protein
MDRALGTLIGCLVRPLLRLPLLCDTVVPVVSRTEGTVCSPVVKFPYTATWQTR